MSKVKEKLPLAEVYKAILRSFGYEVDDEGKVYLVEANVRVPFTIKERHLVVPTKEWLKDPDWENTIPFHPLSENTQRKKSEVFEKLSLIVSNRLYQVGATLLCYLAELAADTDSHAKLSPEQRDFLRMIPDADKRTVDDFRKLARAKMGFKGDSAFVNIFIRRNGQWKGEDYTRLAAVTFPILSQEERADKKIFEVQFRVKDREVLYRILRWIFPNIDKADEHYSFGSRSSVAPNFHALMMSFNGLAVELNKVVDLFSDISPELVELHTDLDWVEPLQSLNEYRNDIPPLDGNIGEANEDELARPKQQAEKRERNRERKELRREISSGRRSLLRAADEEDDRPLRLFGRERESEPRRDGPINLLGGRRDEGRFGRREESRFGDRDRDTGSRFGSRDRDREDRDRDEPISLLGRRGRSTFGRR